MLLALFFLGAVQTTDKQAPPPILAQALSPTNSTGTPTSQPVGAPQQEVTEEAPLQVKQSEARERYKELGNFFSPKDRPVTQTPDTRLQPKYWSEWPLIPVVSERAREIYRAGQELGNDAHSFSTIGDCQSEPAVFMGVYDSDTYTLDAKYAYLEETIQYFQGSFERDSITVKDGMSVASALSPLWADPDLCLANENPLECEIRLHRPSIMFINLGTNWNGGNDVTHEKYMRQIVDVLIARGVVPVLSTKGDNQEGDHRINRSIARVAYDTDVPLWNFWLSLRDLPGKGIDGDREGGYLTTEAWGYKSFTGLLALDAVRRELMTVQ